MGRTHKTKAVGALEGTDRPVCKFKDPAILIAHVSLNPVGANGWANAWTEGSI
jgi:hypothetical protein